MAKKTVTVNSREADIMGRKFVAKVTPFGFSLTIDDQQVFKNSTFEDVRRAQAFIGISLHRMMVLQREELAAKQADMDPADYQEQHSPTKPYMTRVTAKKQKKTARRRASAAQLFESLSEQLQDAMSEIDAAFRATTDEVKPVNLMRYDPPTDRAYGDRRTRGERYLKSYSKWKNLGKRGDFDMDAALKYIVFGFDLQYVDREYHRRNGWAKDNLLASLKAWCKVRGWPVEEDEEEGDAKKDFDTGRRNR